MDKRVRNYSLSELCEACIGDNVHKERICKIVPCGVTKNCAFLIDLQALCSQLAGMRSSLHNVLSVGTDGEKALSNAVCNTFTSATHLRCFKHVKEEKLRRNLNIAEIGQSEILNDLFGYKVDGVQVWLMPKVRMISLTSLLPSNQSGTPLRTNLDELKKEPIHLLFMYGLYILPVKCNDENNDHSRQTASRTWNSSRSILY